MSEHLILSLSPLFEGAPPAVAVLTGVVLALLVAYVVADLAARAVRVILTRWLDGGGPPAEDEVAGAPADSQGALAAVRLVRRVMFVLLAIILAAPAIQLVGVETGNVGLRPEAVAHWLVGSGVRILLIALMGLMIVRAVGLIVKRLERNIQEATTLDLLERAKRARTIGTLVRNVVVVVVTVVAALTILQELGINIIPALAAAGIASLAIGFGAQTLVKDVISGFFLIFENQVRVGDVAAINGTGGLVESLNLRTIVLRDLAGTVHIFPNGSIETLSNMTRDFSYAVFDIGVAYKEDPDEAMKVIQAVGDELQQDLMFAPKIMGPMEILGVDAFGASEVVIKARIKTLPLRQWEIGREFRRRLKKAFDAHGIEIPFPHRTIYFGEATRLLTEMREQAVARGQTDAGRS